MTNKEASKRIKEIIDEVKKCENDVANKDIEALDLAIKALEEVEVENKLKLICAIDNHIVGSLDTGDCPTILKPKQIGGKEE